MSEQLKGITATVAKILVGESSLPALGDPDRCIFANACTDLYVRRTPPSAIEGRAEGRSWEFWMVNHSDPGDNLWYIYCAMANGIMQRETVEDQIRAVELTKAATHIGQMAFWEYDLYPYLLYSIIVDEKNGKVETKGYGKGAWFTPKFILPLQQGESLADELESLKNQRHHETNSVHVRYKAHLDLAVGKYLPQIRTPNA